MTLGAAFGSAFAFTLGNGWEWLLLIPLPLEVSPRPFPWKQFLVFVPVSIGAALLATRPRLARLRLATVAAALFAGMATALILSIVGSRIDAEVIVIGLVLSSIALPIVALGRFLAELAERDRARRWKTAAAFGALAFVTAMPASILGTEDHAATGIARALDGYANQQGWRDYRLIVQEIDSGHSCAAIRFADGSLQICRHRHEGLWTASIESCEPMRATNPDACAGFLKRLVSAPTPGRDSSPTPVPRGAQ